MQALNPDTVFYTLEYMTRNARTQANVFKRICDYWGIAFDKKMLTFRDRFGETFLYRNEQERGIYASNPKGLFTKVMEAKGIRSTRRIPVSFNRTRHSGLPLSLGRLTRLFIGQRLGCMRETSITGRNSGAGQRDDYRLSSGRAVGRVRS